MSESQTPEEQELEQPIHAMLIHGITGQEVQHCILPRGTRYTRESQREVGFGFDPEPLLSTILVEGYRYETYELS